MHEETRQKAEVHVNELKRNAIDASPVAVIEGFASIAYFSPLVNTRRIRQVSDISRQCY